MIKHAITTHDHAKDFAKALKSKFDDGGLFYALKRCHHVTARALGFADWQVLAHTRAWPAIDNETFQRRLLAALPFPCRPPLNAWLAGEVEEDVPPGYPLRWYLDAVPYYLSTAALHHRTPLLRPGSGRGQRLRASIIDGLLMKWAQWGLTPPLLDPVTLDIVVLGKPADIFANFDDKADFERERDRLTNAGILILGFDFVRIASPGVDAVRAHAIWGQASNAKDWIAHDAATAGEPLHRALSLIGVRRAREITAALLAYGDSRYIVASGAMRDVLSKIALDGDLELFALTLNVFAMILPASARDLRSAVPAQILNQFVALNQRVPIGGAFRWMNHNDDWAEALRSAADSPERFAMTVTAMVDGMNEAA